MSKITADILSFEKGAEHFENVKSVRIKTKQYNLMIMDDYMPIIGEVEGNMMLTFDDKEPIVYSGITGYYSHSKNNFEFILKGKTK